MKDTQRLYQNGLILHLARENQDFNIKNKYVYSLTNLAYLINKQFYTSIFGKLGRVRKFSAVRYFTLPQCGAVRYKVLVMAPTERRNPYRAAQVSGVSPLCCVKK